MFIFGAVANARRRASDNDGPQDGSNRVLLVANSIGDLNDRSVIVEPNGGATPYSADEFARALTIERPGVLRNVSVNVGANAAQRACVAQLRVNGQGTSLALDIPAGFVGAKTSTQSLRVSAGDRLSWGILAEGSQGTITITALSVELDTDDALTTYYCANHQDNPNLSALAGPYYQALHIPGRGIIQGWSETTDANAYTRLRSSGTLSHARFYIRSNSLNLPTYVVLVKNGVETNLKFTIPAGASGEFSDLVSTVETAVGDVLYWKRTTPGATSTSDGTLRLGRLQVLFTASAGSVDVISHTFEQAGSPSSLPDVANYVSPGAEIDVQSAEDAARVTLPFGATIRRFAVDGYYNAIGPQTPFDVRLRMDGADAGPLVVIPSGVEYRGFLIDTISKLETPAGAKIAIAYTPPSSYSGPFSVSYSIAPASPLPQPSSPLPQGETSVTATGGAQRFVIPANVAQLHVKLWGAGGGGGADAGGSGGYAEGYVDVVEGDIVTFDVATGGVGLGKVAGQTAPGGYPDGGMAASSSSTRFGSGGGSTRLRVNGVIQFVAGGGGGGGNFSYRSGGGAVSTDSTTELTGYANYKGSPASGIGGGAGGGGGFVGGFANPPAGGGIGYMEGNRVAVGSMQSGPSGSGSASPVPPAQSDAAYQAGVGIGGQGGDAAGSNTAGGAGGPGLIWVRTLALNERVLGSARVFQTHAEVPVLRTSTTRRFQTHVEPVSQPASRIRVYQQHVEVVRTPS